MVLLLSAHTPTASTAIKPIIIAAIILRTFFVIGAFYPFYSPSTICRFPMQKPSGRYAPPGTPRYPTRFTRGHHAPAGYCHAKIHTKNISEQCKSPLFRGGFCCSHCRYERSGSSDRRIYAGTTLDYCAFVTAKQFCPRPLVAKQPARP